MCPSRVKGVKPGSRWKPAATGDQINHSRILTDTELRRAVAPFLLPPLSPAGLLLTEGGGGELKEKKVGKKYHFIIFAWWCVLTKFGKQCCKVLRCIPSLRCTTRYSYTQCLHC